jgi:chromate transporter
MIYLKLFLAFLKIGAVSFGGGYGMISLIREDVLKYGWLTDSELLNFIAVAESTPGPIAVNMATFVGASEGGILGALVATLGIVLPSFLIIILILTLLTRFLKYKGVKVTLSSIRPAVIGMIFATAITMFLSVIFSIKDIGSDFSFDLKSMIIFVILAVISVVFSKIRKKSFSPIFLILVSATLGILFFGI